MRKEEFRNAVLFAADQNMLPPAVVEKDYYVTLILKGLKNLLPFIIFKGGTSLSKCHKVINRFSEDIDVTIDTKLTQGQMGKGKLPDSIPKKIVAFANRECRYY